ncbi:hypothetical protein B0H14DRAFT_3482233 [Mycena olivaceomarginata]|nr:hypothetical protein B0H14DRAFT_3482233 [Mycena olivaceomarginata]
MNSWNSEEVHTLYPAQSLGFLSSVDKDGCVNANSRAVGSAFRTLVKEGADPDAPATLHSAREIARPPAKSTFSYPDFGYVVQWVSEVGSAAAPRPSKSRRTRRGTGRAWIRTSVGD